MADDDEPDSLDTQRIAQIKMLTSKRSPPAISRRDRSAPQTDEGASPSRPPATRDELTPHHAHAVPPRLKFATTAPITLTSTEKVTPPSRMYNSFSGFGEGDGPGDTQVMDSQIYKEFTNGNTFVAAPEHNEDEEDQSTQGDTYGNGTLQEGDTGHVDIVSHCPENGQNDDSSAYGEGNSPEPSLDGESQHGTDFTSHSFIAPPETPATVSKMCNCRDEALSSDTRTPGSATAKLFSNGTGLKMLSMSQLFNGSQGQSSPQLDNQCSDPMFQRPSPGFNMRYSSPVLLNSSPAKPIRSDPLRAATEPRDTYMTMKESQEQREAKKRAELEDQLQRLQAEDTDESEDEVTAEMRKASIRKIQGQLNDITMTVLTEPGEFKSGQKARRQMSDTALFTPARLRKVKSVVELSDGLDAPQDVDEDSLDELSSPPPTSALQRRSQSVQVPMTSSRPHNSSGRQQKIGAHSSQREEHGVPGSQANSSRRRTNAMQQDYQQAVEDDQSDETDYIAVADSQPRLSQRGNGNEAPPSLPNVSSTDARVAQSQYSINEGESSLGVRGRYLQRAINTSSVPRPPEDSSLAQLPVEPNAALADDEEGRNVPSSPPLLAQSMEDDEAVDAIGTDDGEETVDEDSGTDEDMHDIEETEHVSYNEDYDKPDLPADLVDSSQPFRDGDDEQSNNEDEDGEDEVQDETANQVQDDVAHEDGRGAPVEDENQPQFRATLQRIYSTIPETDPMEEDEDDAENPRPQQPEQSGANSPVYNAQPVEGHANEPTGEAEHSTTMQPYETAEPRISALASPLRPHLSQQKSLSSPTRSPAPTKTLSQHTPASTHVRKLTDIAQDPSQAQPFDLDLDFFTESVLTENDKEYQQVMSDIGPSPTRPNKRRKLYSARALQESPRKINHIPSPSPAPDKERMSNTNSFTENNGAMPIENTEEAVFIKPAVMKSGISGKLVRPTAKFYGKKSSAPGKVQEAAAKKTAQRVLEVAEAPQTRLPKDVRKKTTEAPPRPSREEPHPRVLQEEPEVAAPATDDQPIPVDDNTAERVMVEDSATSTPKNVVTPNRVLAWFRGSSMVFYPATCLGLSPDNFRYRIRFDDGAIDNLERNHIRSFDLRKGDLVKVDLNKMRTKSYIVRGFKDIISPAEATAVTSVNEASKNDFPLTDIHGAKTVVLEVKQRNSLPAKAPETVEVLIEKIYITSTMWTHFADRTYSHPSEALLNNARPQTPSTVFSAPDTPNTSKSRRQPPSTLAKSVQRSITEPATPRPTATGIFANMAFAITFGDSAAERDEVCRLITNNGGIILDAGFEALFRTSSHASDTNSPMKPPSTSVTNKALSTPQPKAANSPSTDAAPDEQGLVLTSSAQRLGFTALISDRHSRRTKYIQALALGLPCLSARWIRDCAAARAIKPWQYYLLPAGESTYLNGAVRSRTDLTSYYDASDIGSSDDESEGEARLTRVLQRRPKLLDGKSVLLVTGKSRAKGREDRRRTYEFLTRAMGATRVGRCADAGAARDLLERDDEARPWDWVYVDSAEGEFAEALVSGAGAGGSARKRKRALGAGAGGSGGVCTVLVGEGRGVKVVNDEFVIQSLILGALVEE
ncbi:uncharacterized protein K452DRAFT_299576 [Aplosporella prunicola CBS 121167]|uniref:BRCT domain-containing protein n=1 Tax=Aplosporella prunicola CBS 121167 TaxID=1176127 RepID=A0A6A6B8D8_9PEZI|nr:uncharacterized protein K452DRAFT_299576 [Aplosporella prunicola CBS 121167]KAF2140186.1 hypothetical protein K452DRAFT_299576 [Aplosporella prunicola CBS 121167]